MPVLPRTMPTGHSLSWTSSTSGCIMQVKALCSGRGDREGFWLVSAFGFARLFLSLAVGIWATHASHPELSLAPWSLVRLSHPSITYRTCISMHGQKSRSLNIDFACIQRESHVPMLFHLNRAKKRLEQSPWGGCISKEQRRLKPIKNFQDSSLPVSWQQDVRGHTEFLKTSASLFYLV